MRLIFALPWLALGLAAHAGGAAAPFRSPGELRAALDSVAKAVEPTDSLWSRVLAHREMPLVFGDQVVFLWRGQAESVEWRGDFSSWQPSPETRGRRLGTTDIWTYERSFPRDARLDYKLVLDGETWLVDPLNPHQQLGGYGPNSEVRMPDWRPPENVVCRDGTPRGTLSGDLSLASARLGYAVTYRVYVPSGLDLAAARDLPVLYVTDGSDYWTDGMGALVVTLDNLLSDRRIEPVLVVFIDPWDRKQGVNRREREYVPAPDRGCSFCDFLVEELVPAIDARYPTRRARQGRAIVGASLGGLHATLMVTRYGNHFAMAGVQSPAFGHGPWVLAEAGAAKPLPTKIFIDAGTFEDGIRDGARQLRDTLQRRGIDLRHVELHQGHSWGQWRELLDDLLLFFYGKP